MQEERRGPWWMMDNDGIFWYIRVMGSLLKGFDGKTCKHWYYDDIFPNKSPIIETPLVRWSPETPCPTFQVGELQWLIQINNGNTIFFGTSFQKYCKAGADGGKSLLRPIGCEGSGAWCQLHVLCTQESHHNQLGQVTHIFQGLKKMCFLCLRHHYSCYLYLNDIFPQ